MGNNFFLMKIRGAKWGTNFFWKEFSWEEILGGMFWRRRFFWGGNLASKIFGEYLASYMSFGKKKRIVGSKNVLEERYGEQKFLRANCYLKWFLHRTNLNTRLRKMLDVSDEPFSTLV